MEMLCTIDPLTRSFSLRLFTWQSLISSATVRWRCHLVHSSFNVCSIAPPHCVPWPWCWMLQQTVLCATLAHPTSIPRCVSSLQTNKEFDDTIRLVAPNTIRHRQAQCTLHRAHWSTWCIQLYNVHAVDGAKGKSNQAERTQWTSRHSTDGRTDERDRSPYFHFSDRSGSVFAHRTCIFKSFIFYCSFSGYPICGGASFTANKCSQYSQKRHQPSPQHSFTTLCGTLAHFATHYEIDFQRGFGVKWRYTYIQGVSHW